MVFKFIGILIFVAVGSASLIPTNILIPDEPVQVKAIDEHHSYPQYTYTYGVEDSISGDSKSQVESRNGDVVHGEYSLNDPDGYRRTVKYTADAVNGFNAVVDRKPLVETASVDDTPVVVKAVAPVVAPAPVVVQTVSPVTYTTQIKSVPISYSIPTHIKSAPIAYASPTLIKSVPATYISQHAPGLVYTSGPAVYKSIPFAYGAPTLVNAYNRL